MGTAPSVITTAESATTTASTSHTVNLPASRVVGNTLFIFGCYPAVDITTSATGWSAITLGLGSGRLTNILSRTVDGTESATVTCTSSASDRAAFISYQIQGLANDGFTSIDTPTSRSTGTSTTPDPPNSNFGDFTAATIPSDVLCIVLFAQAGEEADDDTWTTAAPGGYTGLLQKTCGTAGGASSNVSMGSAHRQIANASSENPGTFTVVQNLAWDAQIVTLRGTRGAYPFSRKDSSFPLRDTDPWSATGWRQ